MKFFLKLIMGESGDFPGAPDSETLELTSEEYDKLFDLYFGKVD